MLIVSFWTSLLGFTEPIFVPEYWNPPSLFDLARRTGFDIESILFSFAVGGVVVIVYEYIFGGRHRAMTQKEKHDRRHRLHFWVIFSAPAVFVFLLFASSLNPIYSASFALLAGFFATWYCRPDLVKKMLVSGFLFSFLYFIVFLLLDTLFPGYVEEVWNLPDLSGILIWRVPIEEILWAYTFGLYWSSIYEHLTWRKIEVGA